MMDPSLPPGAYSWLSGRQKFFPVGLANKDVVGDILGFSRFIVSEQISEKLNKCCTEENKLTLY